MANNPKDAPADAGDAAVWKAKDGFENTLKPLADVLATDPEVIRFCSRTDIAALLNPDAYTGTAVQQVERVIRKLSPLCG